MIVGVALAVSAGASGNDETPSLAAGLVGRYYVGEPAERAPALERVDPTLAFDWSDGSPDERLPPGPFTVVWTGFLRLDDDGDVRFSSRGNGRLRVWIAERIAYDSTSPSDARTVTLEYGEHALRVEYRAPATGAAVQLLWESDFFAPEPIGARWLFHRGGSAAEEPPYDRGRRLFDRYGCDRCHGRDEANVAARLFGARRPGPPLVRSARIVPDYLARWLRDPRAIRPGTPMPALGGTSEEIATAAASIAAFLASSAAPEPARDEVDDTGAIDAGPNAERGRVRFHELGCVACHAPDSPLAKTERRAPTLADVGSKWPREAITDFLLAPLRSHPEGLMPDFGLDRRVAEDLTAYLAGFRLDARSSSDDSEPLQSDAAAIAAGRGLVERLGCGACHELPATSPPTSSSPPVAPSLAELSSTVRAGESDELASRGCLRSNRAADKPSGPRAAPPFFAFDRLDRQALVAFLGQRPRSPTIASRELARRAFDEQLGCRECHTRDGTGREQLATSAESFCAKRKDADPARMTPPDLDGIGARLRRESLVEMIRGDAPRARPWLSVSMPRFALSQREVAALADWLETTDRIPRLRAPRAQRPPTDLTATGWQLVGGSGFSCVTCHHLGGRTPTGESHAPELTLASRRVSRAWFHRYLDAPSRRVADVTMPAFVFPVAGVLDGDLFAQKEAVWQFLKHTPADKLGDLVASESSTVRVAGRRPRVVQGRVLGFANVTRGIAIGLPNRTSVLFDYERMTWKASWTGGFLERTGRHGAQQWWDPAGEPVWVDRRGVPPILFRHRESGEWLAPASWRKRFGFLDRVTIVGRAVRLEYRLRAPGAPTGTHEARAWIDVDELVEPNPPGAVGFTRTVRVRSVPQEYDIVLGVGVGASHDAATTQVTPSASDNDAWHDLPALAFRGADRRRREIRVTSNQRARWIAPPDAIVSPVEQPFTDDPMDPATRYPPESLPGAGLASVLVENPGAASLEVVWQHAVAPPGPPATHRPPRRWAGPPVREPLQDLDAPRYAHETIAPSVLAESRRPAVPPGFRIERLPLPDDFLVCALTFWKGRFLVGGYDGELRIADDTDGDGSPDRYRHFGGTLQQENNLRVFDGEIYATSPGAVYRIRDLDGDEIADSYELLSSLWDWSGHQNDWFNGLTRDREGNLYGANSTAFIYRPGGKPPGYYLRGDVLKITPDGRTIRCGTGTRFQFGWAQSAAGHMYFNINQGHYNYTNGIHLVIDGAHYGFLEPDLSKVQKPVIRAPYPWCKSLTGMAFAESPVPFGPFQGQGFSGDYNTNQVIRWTDYAVGEDRQGTCYPFLTGTDAGPTEIAFGPDGALYVGFMCDQGWYGGRARGGIYRVTYEGPPTVAVREARVERDGFRLEFTVALDPDSVSPDACRSVHRWWHENKGAYASPEIAHEDVPVQDVTLSADGRSLRLNVDVTLVPRLYRIRLRGLRARDGRPLPDEPVFLTVHDLPR